MNTNKFIQELYEKHNIEEALRGDNTTHEGEFQEKEYGNWFSYKKAKENPFGLPHEIDVGTGGGLQSPYRFGHVKGTVAHVAVDEDEYGKPVMEKWQLKKHNKYSQ
jgi:hypothetical protein